MQCFFRFRSRVGIVGLLLLAWFAVPFVAAAEAVKKPPETAHVAAVDINEASATALAEVPGIGEVMAERIVAWRKEHGPFERVEDLMKVKGIGEKSLEKLKPYLRVAAHSGKRD